VPLLRQKFLSFLYQFGKTNFSIHFIYWVINHMSFILPVNQLEVTSQLIAFFHPQPSYPFHVVIVPKVEIPSMMDLSPTHTPFLCDCFATIQKIVAQYNLGTSGYRVVINGGKNQEFPILHFHLISDKVI